MANTIYDSTKGFLPIGGPIQVVWFTVGATAVKRGTAVKFDGSNPGKIIPVTATGGGQIGVALAAGAVGASVPVNIDPETLYEATADDQAVAITDIGKVVVITAESSSSEVSNQMVDVSAATGTITANHVFQIIGLPSKVTNVAAASNLKLIVKMVMSKLEPFVDAT